MKTFLIALGIFFIIVIIGFTLRFVSKSGTAETTSDSLRRFNVGSASYAVEIATSTMDQARGLSYRQTLPQNQGMLFIFNQPEDRKFWMLGMKFPLDFIWIREGLVVAISENIPPPKGVSMPQVIDPLEATDMVLEVNAGEIAKQGIKVGQKTNLEE